MHCVDHRRGCRSASKVAAISAICKSHRILSSECTNAHPVQTLFKKKSWAKELVLRPYNRYHLATPLAYLIVFILELRRRRSSEAPILFNTNGYARLIRRRSGAYGQLRSGRPRVFLHPIRAGRVEKTGQASSTKRCQAVERENQHCHLEKTRRPAQRTAATMRQMKLIKCVS